MRRLLTTLAAGLVTLAGAARAEDAKPAVVFNLGVASDYPFRGVSQTNEKPDISGGADLTAGRFYAGTWLSNVDFGDSTDLEYDLYAGFRPTFGKVTLDLGVIRYGYGGQPHGADYDNWEAKVAASVPAGKATLGGAIFYSPDSFGAAKQAVYYEVNAAAPLNDRVTLSAALGRQTYRGTGDYTTWNAGVGWAITPKLGLDLRYYDTDEHRFGKLYDSRAVAALKATF